MLTAEQFAEWKSHPVTTEIFDAIREVRQGLMDQIGEGQTISNHADTTHGQTCRIVGHIEGLNQLMNISYADRETEEVVGQDGY